MSEQFPSIVLALAEKVGLTPAKWREENNKIVIHFTTGQKIVFERLPLEQSDEGENMPTTPAKETKTPAIKTNTTPAKKPTTPAIKSHAGRKK